MGRAEQHLYYSGSNVRRKWSSIGFKDEKQFAAPDFSDKPVASKSGTEAMLIDVKENISTALSTVWKVAGHEA